MQKDCSPPRDNNVILWPGQFGRTQGTHPKGTRRMADTPVVDVECVNTTNSTVIARCWEAISRTARVEWFEYKKTLEMPYEQLFYRKEAMRVDAR